MTRLNFLTTILFLLLSATANIAQTTGFTYQGALSDGGTPANGNYDLQFSLWDSANGGGQIGSTQTLPAVPVSNGIFSVALDFGANAFPGANRFLEISARQSGAGSLTLLTPRQQIMSTPYAVRAAASTAADQLSAACVGCVSNSKIASISGSKVNGPVFEATNADDAVNSQQLGGVAANQYVKTSDARLSDSRSPTSGSSNYIQSTNNQQTANFNIAGNGTIGNTLKAGVVNATTEFQLGANRILGISGSTTILGIGAGTSNAANFNSFFGTSAGADTSNGDSNSFFGSSAGKATTLGSANSFFGARAGLNNITGYANSFFGASAGLTNGTYGNNSFFGYQAGQFNQAGDNSFFGQNAGRNNSGGAANAFFGAAAGELNNFGGGNAFFGQNAGSGNVDGDFNTLVGKSADVGTNNLQNATALGANARVDQSYSLVLGGIGGVNGASFDTRVGIGTTTPSERLTIKTPTNNYGFIHTDGNITVGSYLGGAGNGGYIGTKSNHPLHFFVNNGSASMTVDTGGVVHLNTLGTAGSTSLCRNASNQISTCSSSLRYKTNVQPFFAGLDVINRLRPITFDWKEGGLRDIGLGAEEVAQIAPLLTFRNDKGEVEGVKYAQLSVLLINAAKEQQAEFLGQQRQIEQQAKLIAQQQSQLKELAQKINNLQRLKVSRRHRSR